MHVANQIRICKLYLLVILLQCNTLQFVQFELIGSGNSGCLRNKVSGRYINAQGGKAGDQVRVVFGSDNTDTSVSRLDFVFEYDD